MTWNTMGTLPKDRPVRLAYWCDASKFGDNPEAHWRDMGAFKAETSERDASLVAVKTDRTYWLRGGTFQNGRDSLAYWRWTELAPLPTEPAF